MVFQITLTSNQMMLNEISKGYTESRDDKLQSIPHWKLPGKQWILRWPMGW